MTRQKPKNKPHTLEEPLSQEELQAYQLRLQELFEALQSEVEHVETDVLRPSGGERGQADEEAIEDTVLDVELGALAVEDELGYSVQDALERISEGTYGVCATCGEWISRERLRLLPYARMCSSCARQPE